MPTMMVIPLHQVRPFRREREKNQYSGVNLDSELRCCAKKREMDVWCICLVVVALNYIKSEECLYSSFYLFFYCNVLRFYKNNPTSFFNDVVDLYDIQVAIGAFL